MTQPKIFFEEASGTREIRFKSIIIKAQPPIPALMQCPLRTQSTELDLDIWMLEGEARLLFSDRTLIWARGLRW